MMDYLLTKPCTDVGHVNHILNHPSVYPWIKGWHEGKFDISKWMNNDNVILAFEHGCSVFVKHQIGVYEWHVAVLPEGRGQQSLLWGRRALNWMFVNTDAVDILAQCPPTNPFVRIIIQQMGLKKEFVTRSLWPTKDGKVPVDVYSMSIQEWIRDINDIPDKHAVISDYMVKCGQKEKGINFFNRWAAINHYEKMAA